MLYCHQQEHKYTTQIPKLNTGLIKAVYPPHLVCENMRFGYIHKKVKGIRFKSGKYYCSIRCLIKTYIRKSLEKLNESL
jgi:hypothetical protein